MDDTFIITVFVVSDELCRTFLGTPKYHPKMVPAEIITVAVVAARYFNNCGHCAAKKEKFFGWRLHLICTPHGVPVAFELLPAALHDLTPIYELTVDLPSGASLFGDKAFNYQAGEVFLASECLRLIPIRKKNMEPHAWADEYDLALYRKSIETVNSQLESMGVERLRARTNAGLEIKVHASLIALWHTQMLAN